MQTDEPASTFPNYPAEFEVKAYLRPDVLSSEIMARRTVDLMSRLRNVHPLLQDWLWGEWEDYDDPVVETPFDLMCKDLVAAVERKQSPYPGETCWIPDQNGYYYPLLSSRDEGVAVNVCAGGWDSLNQVWFHTSNRGPADPGLLTFDVTRAVTLALCESFHAMYCFGFPNAIAPYWTEPGRCRMGSIVYLGPAGASLVTPPPAVVVEHRPDGGLVLAATRDRFDLDNPVHIANARAIHAALAPYNALPKAI